MPAAALTTLALVGTTACGAAPGAVPESGGKPQIIGSFYPMAWIAQRVGGADAAVRDLTQPGTEPHDIELSPRQIVDVSKATYVVYVKGVQPAVDKAVEQYAKGRSLDATSVVKRLPAAGTGSGRTPRATAFDPHIWLDPHRLGTVATVLGDRLATVDPAHAGRYRANAKNLTADLARLDAEFTDGLRNCAQRTFVTSHAAFSYLADHYGMEQVPISGTDPHSEPSPKRLAELVQVIRDNKVSTIFTETQIGSKAARSLANEVRVRTATLDPLEIVVPGSKDDYLSIMRRNLRTLRTGLSCT